MLSVPTLTQTLSTIPLLREAEHPTYRRWSVESDWNSYEEFVGRCLSFGGVQVIVANNLADELEATDIYVQMRVPDATVRIVRVNVTCDTSITKRLKCYEKGVVPLQLRAHTLDDERITPSEIVHLLRRSTKSMFDLGYQLHPIPPLRQAALERLFKAAPHGPGCIASQSITGSTYHYR